MSLRWYVIQTHSGFENKVSEAISEKAQRLNLQSSFSDILVPAEEVVEIRKGKKINVSRKFLPGYVLVRMEMNDQTWHLVHSITRVNGFLGEGHGKKPTPISDEEAMRMLGKVEESIEKKKYAIYFEVGEEIRVIDGPFQSFNGIVEEVDEEKARLKVSVMIFGRATPVTLEYNQVEKTS